jgi:hypothetical protein
MWIIVGNDKSFGAINMFDVSKIDVRMNLCDSASQLKFAGMTFNPGHKGKLDIALVAAKVLDGDLLEFGVPGKPDRAKVGGASEISGLSIRVCKDKTSIIAVYKNPEMNLDGCCACGPCGVCVYGSFGCDPGCH